MAKIGYFLKCKVWPCSQTFSWGFMFKLLGKYLARVLRSHLSKMVSWSISWWISLKKLFLWSAMLLEIVCSSWWRKHGQIGRTFSSLCSGSETVQSACFLVLPKTHVCSNLSDGFPHCLLHKYFRFIFLNNNKVFVSIAINKTKQFFTLTGYITVWLFFLDYSFP